MTARRRQLGPLCGIVLACLAALTPERAVHAYLKLGATAADGDVALKWSQMPVRYFINEQGGPGISAEEFRTAVERATRTWQDLPTSSMTFEFGGFTRQEPLEDDNVNTFGFLSRPDLDRVLASTNFLIDVRTGEILESDIFFNSTVNWSVAEAGAAGRFDVQSIALHETGHFQGLGHSALGETERSGGGRRLIASGAVMFPIAFSGGIIAGREPTADDIAGVSDLYPDGGVQRERGSIDGHVTKNGTGVFGAHVVAYHLESGDLVGGFALDDTGAFVIAGLRPGAHVVRVEPLDDADIDSFFDENAPVDLQFQPLVYDKLVVVPAGGAARGVELAVTPK
jgi:hypothetical protein